MQEKMTEEEISLLEILLKKMRGQIKQGSTATVEKTEQESSPAEPEPESSDEESLLVIDDLPKTVAEPKNSDTLTDVGEELVEDDEPEEIEQEIRPRLEKNSSLNEEVLEEGQGRGNKQCVRVAFSTAPRKNRFKDNISFAKEDTIKFDKKVRTQDSIQAHSFIQKRPPAQKIIVRCRNCSRRYKIDSKFAPQRLDSQDSSSYQCDNCILQRKG